MSETAAGKKREPVWFRPEERGQDRAFSLDTIYEGYRRDRDRPETQKHNVPGQTWLCSYILPPFQRPFVWTLEQEIRFIESAARGLPLGTYTFNDADRFPNTVIDGVSYMNRTDRWLIDGQQRITALMHFFDDQYPVYGYRYSEIPVIEQRRFLMTAFSAYEIQNGSEADLRRMYNLMNFAGTPHTDADRA